MSIIRAISGFFGVDRFKVVYWIIALATAQHTAWGAATTMQGTSNAGQPEWWAQGLAFAIAVDFSMVMVATKIRSGSATGQRVGIGKLQLGVNWYTITFAIVALVSFYFQLLYAWAHAMPLENVGGVAQEWVVRLQPLIAARIVIAPAALPVIATLYTLGGFGKGGEVQSKRNKPQPSRNEDAITIAKEVADIAPKLLPGATQMRNEAGELQGYICPGCNKELSISGWSRHKKSCKQYVEIMHSVNGRER